MNSNKAQASSLIFIVFGIVAFSWATKWVSDFFVQPSQQALGVWPSLAIAGFFIFFAVRLGIRK